MLTGFALLKVLPDAEDRRKSCGKGKVYLVNKLRVCLAIVLTALGMSEYGVFSAYGSQHINSHLPGVGSLLLVGAVLC